MEIFAIEIFDNHIKIEFVDGSIEEISGGIYEFKDAGGRTQEQRVATQADFDRLIDLGTEFESGLLPIEAEVVEVTNIGGIMEVHYADGSREEIGNGIYERKNADNETILERVADQADWDRLSDMFFGNAGAQPAGNDDGTPDQGPGDAPGTPSGGLRGSDDCDTIVGSDGDDFIFGGLSENDLRDVIYGGYGDDSIDGGYGNDEMRGDDGNDTILGGNGVDLVIGGTGDDQLNGQGWSDDIFGGAGADFINGGFGSDRLNGGADADRFFHLGIRDHGADWVQDYTADDGDRLQFGQHGSREHFQVNFVETENSGAAGIEEAFVIYRPTGQILWALVDGASQTQINLLLDGVVYDLLA